MHMWLKWQVKTCAKLKLFDAFDTFNFINVASNLFQNGTNICIETQTTVEGVGDAE
jgi:hypothetical protein